MQIEIICYKCKNSKLESWEKEHKMVTGGLGGMYPYFPSRFEIVLSGIKIYFPSGFKIVLSGIKKY